MPNTTLFLFLTLFLAAGMPAHAQITVPGEGSRDVRNGYAHSISGETLPYFSVYPDYAKTALLTRCTDGQKFIEWETAPAPEALNTPYVYFSWIAAHSTGTSKGERHFDLYINEQKVLTFSTYPNNYPDLWSFAGADSTRLLFEFKTRDGAADAHGIAYLRVPAKYCQAGKPLRLKVVGQNQQSTDWYMTFEYAFEEKIELEALPFLLRGATPQQPLQIKVLHFGAPDTLFVQLPNQAPAIFPVQNGIQTFDMAVKAVSSAENLFVQARIGKRLKMEQTLVLKPVTFREIDLIHHAHTDIGYSHYQEEVATIHSTNIREALRMVERTRNYPEGSRFIWQVESLWAVENFLRSASPDEATRFVQATQQGKIVLAGLYANVLTGLCSPEELRWLTEYADTLRQRYQAPIQTAMFSDIPGLNWDIVPALAGAGIRYFSNGPNFMEGLPDKGDRIGSTLRAQGDRPFWWKSASGRDSILMWTCGKGYSSWHGFTEGATARRGPQKIAAYLNELEAAQYPYDMVQWRYNIVADNGPVDSSICDFVRDWNEKYASPRLVLANVTDVFKRFEAKYGAQIPVWSGDFSPYWEDGAYSSAKEETEARLLSNRLTQLQQLAAQQKTNTPPDWWYAARRHIILFHEHTWGSWNSITQPDDLFSTRQWDYKKRLLDSARYEIQRLEQALLPVATSFEKITVYNTLGWKRSGWVEIPWPKTMQTDALKDDRGQVIHVQKLSNGKGLFIAQDVPANGQRVYTPAKKQAPKIPFTSNAQWQTDPETGALTHLFRSRRKWSVPGRYKGLLQTLYYSGLSPDSVRTTSFVSQEMTENGPLLRRTRIHCNIPGANSVTYEISQYNGLPLLHLAVEIDKMAVRDKESMHIALPFNINNPEIRFGAGDAWCGPKTNRIPGSNNDFFCVQRWLDVSNAQSGVTINCPQGALFEPGTPLDERRNNQGYKTWKTTADNSSDILLYALNNYWHTNYKADQEGLIRYDFYLHFHRKFDAGESERWGKEAGAMLIGVWK